MGSGTKNHAAGSTTIIILLVQSADAAQTGKTHRAGAVAQAHHRIVTVAVAKFGAGPSKSPFPGIAHALR